MSNAEHLANVMVEAFIAAVERGVDLVPVVADSTSTAKIAPFIKQFPGRLVNVGIAEQSMVGTAAGLALGGKVAVTCNAAPFLISRANEQIKVDVCYNNTNVKLFGLNAGASYGPLASTHHSIDDLAVMRGFGNIQIFAPPRRANVGRLLITPSVIRGRSIFALMARRCRNCTMKAIALYRARSSRCGKAMISRWWPPVRRCMRWWRRRSSLPTSVSRRKWSACRRFAPAIPRRCWRRSSHVVR